MTGRENIFMNGAILGMTHNEIQRKLDEIIDFSGCERYIDTPVKRYSSGMMVRLGFAVAAHLDPEILVVDEVLAVGDAEFQKKAIGKMQDVSKGEGRTVLFVSHNMASVKALCHSGIMLENGMVKYMGTAEQTIQRYLLANYGDTNTDILLRKDKEGNKKVEVVNVTFKDINGKSVDEFFLGDYIAIEWTIKKNEAVDMSKMIVACWFSDPYMNPAVVWVSDEMKVDFSAVGDKFRLVIPSLPLRPNQYQFGYQISFNKTAPSDWSDRLENARSVNVIAAETKNSLGVVNREGYSPLINAYFEQK